MSLITVRTFTTPEEAHLLRMRLEAGGVPAVLQDEYMIQMDWGISNALGGVRLQIDERDIERAREILEDQGEPLPSDRPVCPACASIQTAPDELPRRLSFLSMVMVGFPFLIARHRWKCADCGNTWNERTASSIGLIRRKI